MGVSTDHGWVLHCGIPKEVIRSSAGHRAGLTLRDPGGGYHWLNIEQVLH